MAGMWMEIKKINKRSAGSDLCILVLLIVSLFPPGFGLAEEMKKSEPVKTTGASTSPAAIPVPEVATRATEVSDLVRSIRAKLETGNEIDKIRRSLLEASEKIDREFIRTEKALHLEPSLEALQTEEKNWQQMHILTAGWLKTLTTEAVRLRETTKETANLEEVWTMTRRAAQSSKAPAPILRQIDEVLTSLKQVESLLKAQVTSVLNLQGRVANAVGRCDSMLAGIAEVQRKAMGGIMTRSSVPIWDSPLWVDARFMIKGRAGQVGAALWQDLSLYVRGSSKGVLLQLGTFALLAIGFYLLRFYVRRWEMDKQGISSSPVIFETPFSAASLGFLFFVTGPYSSAPTLVKALAAVLTFAPMIRLIRPIVDPGVMPGLYALWALFVFDIFRRVLAGTLLEGQILLVLETLVGMTVLSWSLFRGHLKRTARKMAGTGRDHALRAAAVLILLTLGAAFMAGILGYLRLARILASQIVVGGTLALGLAVLVRIFTGVTAFALRTRPLTLLHMVEHYRDLLERRTHRMVIWLAAIVLIHRLLDYTGLLEPGLSVGRAILAAKVERGTISISVADVAVFFLTVLSAYLVSAVIRFALQEEIYPRIGVPRGQSYAVSSLLNYIILALGFILALGIVGVNLNRVTVLAGAFGVGIGFGLQNVVNNFVSGLVLLFERPLHVGDSIEVGDLLGEVRRIGIRASTVHTWRGSDIIVPNADLISKQVTNWTLSDRLRRIDLPLGVNYGASPGQVIGILEATASEHPDVLKDPKPQGLFTGYGDSSINFELRFWTDRFDDWPRIRSDVAVAVYDAVLKAGITFPFPQRVVRLLNEGDGLSTPTAESKVPEGALKESPPGPDQSETIKGPGKSLKQET